MRNQISNKTIQKNPQPKPKTIKNSVISKKLNQNETKTLYMSESVESMDIETDDILANLKVWICIYIYIYVCVCVWEEREREREREREWSIQLVRC